MFSINVAFTAETKPDWISWLIMFFLRTNYSHVLIIFTDVDGQRKILHSVGKGTCIESVTEFLKTHKIVKSFLIPMLCTQAEFSMWAKGRSGREYSDSQYVNIFFRFLGLKWVPFKNGHAKAICSEEVAAVAPMTKLELPESYDIDLIHPKDIENFLDKAKLAERVV